MSRLPLEKRVSELERRLAELQERLSAVPGPHDWRRAVGAFTDDPGMQQVLDEALRLRIADRARTRPQGPNGSKGTGRRARNRAPGRT